MMTAQCVTRDQLQEYLSGWTAPEQSESIEAHLVECSACEQAATALERGSDTFLESVRRSQTQPKEPDAESAEFYLATALDRAKQVTEVAEVAEDSRSRQPGNPQFTAAAADIGSYELLRPIGHGGMGSVYLARHRQLGKQLAIKLLSAKLNRNGGYTARFQREMRAAGGLDHPAIVRATDAGEHNGTHYLAMEYIEGLDLSRVARLIGKFSIADACEIARQVALGLSHAHAAGVTHRDIKPSNIMLSTSGQVKILDFGLARLNLWDEVSAELTTVGQLIGTLDYMAPEQADRPESVDYRADLYALGATLFRLLCGRAPLAASPEMSPLAKLRLLATHQPPSLATLRPDAPEPLVRLVASLLAREPESRPASAAHVAEELTAFARDSDLPALVSRAQSCAQHKPEVATAELVSDSLQSIHAFNSQPSDVAAVGAKPPRRAGRLILWAFAPVALLAGVLITLETQKGSLVIESESANVSIKLLRDGKLYEQLKIEPGATSTRLYAGQYEVALDGGSDSLVVEGQHVEVRRGETTIARIRQQPAQVAAVEPKLDRDAEIASLRERLAKLQETAAPAGDEPLYNGKPLSYWLDMVGREKSLEGYEEALTALKAMMTPDNADRIASVLLPVLRGQPGRQQIGSGKNRDRTAFLILRSAYPGRAYYELIVKELEGGDRVWQARIFAALVPLGLNDAQAIEPLTEWLESNVFAKGGRSELLLESANFYQTLVQAPEQSSLLTDQQKQWNLRAKEHYAKVLLDCEALDDAFWLGKPSYAPPASPNAVYVPWSPALGDRIEERAIYALSDLKSDRKLATQAVVILSLFHSPRYDRTGMKERRAELVEAIRTALTTFQVDPAGLYEPQQLQPQFDDCLRTIYVRHQIFMLSPTSLEPAPLAQISNFTPYSIVFPSLALVKPLIEELSAGEELADELVWVFEATSRLNAELFAMRDARALIALSWPDLELLSPDQHSKQKILGASREHWVAAILHGEAYSLLPQEIQANLKKAEYRKYISSIVADEMRQHDADSDGQLSFEEAKPVLDDPQKADSDGDGRLSAEELTEFRIEQQQASPTSERGNSFLDWVKKQIEKYDRDQDGKLSRDESSRMTIKPDRADIDGDGFITVEEYVKFRQLGR